MTVNACAPDCSTGAVTSRNATDADVDVLEQLGVGVVVDLRGDAERVIEGESRLPRGARGRVPPDGRRARRPRHPRSCSASGDVDRIKEAFPPGAARDMMLRGSHAVRRRRRALRAVRRVRAHPGRGGRHAGGRALLRGKGPHRVGDRARAARARRARATSSSTTTCGRTSRRRCGWRTWLGRRRAGSIPGCSNRSSWCTWTTSPRRSTALEEYWGGIDGYLGGGLGVDAQLRSQLRSVFLEPAPTA